VQSNDLVLWDGCGHLLEGTLQCQAKQKGAERVALPDSSLGDNRRIISWVTLD
jgi:hypothetical protein